MIIQSFDEAVKEVVLLLLGGRDTDEYKLLRDNFAVSRKANQSLRNLSHRHKDFFTLFVNKNLKQSNVY